MSIRLFEIGPISGMNYPPRNMEDNLFYKVYPYYITHDVKGLARDFSLSMSLAASVFDVIESIRFNGIFEKQYKRDYLNLCLFLLQARNSDMLDEEIQARVELEDIVMEELYG